MGEGFSASSLGLVRGGYWGWILKDQFGEDLDRFGMGPDYQGEWPLREEDLHPG